MGVTRAEPRNNGRGIEMLRAVGIPGEVGLLADEAAADLSRYLDVPPHGRRND